jgi:hypothetical protein
MVADDPETSADLDGHQQSSANSSCSYEQQKQCNNAQQQQTGERPSCGGAANCTLTTADAGITSSYNPKDPNSSVTVSLTQSIAATTQNADGTTTITRATVTTSVTDNGSGGTTYTQTVSNKQTISVDANGASTYGAASGGSRTISASEAAQAFGNGAGANVGAIVMRGERFSARMDFVTAFNHAKNLDLQDRIGSRRTGDHARDVLKVGAELVEALTHAFE